MKSEFSRSTITLIAVTIAFLPLVGLQLWSSVSRIDQAIIVLPVLLFLGCMARIEFSGFALANRRRELSWGLQISALVLGFFGALLVSPTVVHLALLLFVTSWLLVYFGQTNWSRLGALAVLLWVTLPTGLANQMNAWLVEQAVAVSSLILDVAGVAHHAGREFIELRLGQIELKGHFDGAFSFYTLLVLSLAGVFFLRRSLLSSLLTLVCVPLVYWCTQTVMILVEVMAVEQFTSSPWSSGLSFWLVQIVSCLVACLMLWALTAGFWQLLFPVPVDSAERANKSIYKLYNTGSIWPLNVDAVTGTHYSQQTKPDPSSQEAGEDPWNQNRAFYPALFALAFAFLFGLVGVFVPVRSDTVTADDADRKLFLQLAQLDPAVDVASASLVGRANPSLEDLRLELNWNLTVEDESATLTAHYPTRGLVPSWNQLLRAGHRLTSPPTRQEVELQSQEFTIFSPVLVDSVGRTVYIWQTAVRKDGQSFAPAHASLYETMKQRWARSAPSRIFGNQPAIANIQLRLTIQSSRLIPERKRKEINQTFAAVAHNLTQALHEQTKAPSGK